ncbi:uncharacterized protein LOC126619435 isoform X1 [Malus sylvestris]|uniref:uncharacterized protein LOC126619435 isoform X1 n=1 Tax=Malus sylvestris TaxID=3752 RepID=UPI0021AC5C49|nr:uncharacterized protein LOC126619435 isoform X1 [Malus sylvestris]
MFIPPKVYVQTRESREGDGEEELWGFDRETMIGIGNRYNLQSQVVFSSSPYSPNPSPPNSMPTTVASVIPSSNAPSLASLPARVSASSALSALGPGSKLLFPSPQDMIMLTEKKEYKRAIKQVKGGRLPAVFYFTTSACPNTVTYSIPIVRKIREHFPHVKLYKVLITVESDLRPIAHDLGVSIMPTFLFYQNGVKVDEVVGAYADPVMDICEKLYRYVRPVETPQRTRSSWKGKTDTQQLVLQAKKDENDVVVAGGWKVGDGSMFFQWKGGAVAVDSSDVPSVSEVMKDVESLCTAPKGFSMWCFAKGLFTAKPEKRVIFSNIKDPRLKIGWFREEMEVE